jgi:hypothetical protein
LVGLVGNDDDVGVVRSERRHQCLEFNDVSPGECRRAPPLFSAHMPDWPGR